MTLLAVSALLCAMTITTLGAALEPHVFSKFSSCPCAWTQFQDRCFIYVPKAMTWAEAQQHCQSMRANLASVRSFAEYTAIQSLTAIDRYRNTWIGASDAQQDRFWFWSDGTPFTYTNWCPYQPDHRHTGTYGPNGPYCIQMNFGVGKCWDDGECKAVFPSICAKKVLG
ncbi:type-2 ice-structuring protein-like [Labrus bergylta]|uniref:Type-2 ice-structuring protein-like n=1 Tax=Labrus bergylta TaxID=56723 RepID=A0A3Q3EZZ4_9LABR|nr:type-2 ice-structuring protein-like [Labrus bergylta]